MGIARWTCLAAVRCCASRTRSNLLAAFFSTDSLALRELPCAADTPYDARTRRCATCSTLSKVTLPPSASASRPAYVPNKRSSSTPSTKRTSAAPTRFLLRLRRGQRERLGRNLPMRHAFSSDDPSSLLPARCNAQARCASWRTVQRATRMKLVKATSRGWTTKRTKRMKFSRTGRIFATALHYSSQLRAMWCYCFRRIAHGASLTRAALHQQFGAGLVTSSHYHMRIHLLREAVVCTMRRGAVQWSGLRRVASAGTFTRVRWHQAVVLARQRTAASSWRISCRCTSRVQSYWPRTLELDLPSPSRDRMVLD